jgi:hypothetical protein
MLNVNICTVKWNTYNVKCKHMQCEMNTYVNLNVNKCCINIILCGGKCQYTCFYMSRAMLAQM